MGSARNERGKAAAATAAEPRRANLELPRAWPATLLIVVVAAFLIGALAAYWPRLMGNTDDERIAALEARLEQLGGNAPAAAAAPRGNQDAADRRFSSLETRLGTLERNAPSIFNPQVGATLDQRVTAAEQKNTEVTQSLAALIARLNSVEAATPADLPQRLQMLAPKAELDNLNARVSRIEALRYAASVLALARLARAADEARPFAREYEALSTINPGDPAIQKLQPYAQRGIPTLDMLQARFPEAARIAINAERAALADGFWERQWVRLRNLISIRRLTVAAGTDSESRLARAQVALGRGNLAAALNDTRALEGAAANSIAPWQRDAEARLAIDRSIDDMELRVTEMLGRAPAPLPAELDAPAAEGAGVDVPGIGVLPRGTGPAAVPSTAPRVGLAAPPGGAALRPAAPAPAPAVPRVGQLPPVGPAPPAPAGVAR
jgi:hypothetical protein